MANVPSPPIAPRTALWGLGFALEKISLRFKSLYESIKEVWLLGPYLSWPFYLIYWLFDEAKQKSWEADDKLVEIATWINGIINGTVIRDILDQITWVFYQIRTDPIGFVRDRLQDISYEFTLIRQNPGEWVKNKILSVWPILNDLIYYTYNWYRNLLAKHFPLLLQLFDNPFGTLRNWVLDLFYWAREFNADVRQAIINFISQRAWWFSGFITQPVSILLTLFRQYRPDIADFLDSPLVWVRRRIMDLLGIPYAEEYNVIFFLVKRAIAILASNQGAILNIIERQICDIIMFFI